MEAEKRSVRSRANQNYGSTRACEGSRNRSSAEQEIIIHNIKYTVPVKNKGKKTQKEILKNVSGFFKPGLNAILGPTGSGKTTLLDVIAGRKEKKYLSGTVLVNGEAQPNNFKLISGYVVQEDIVLGTLTVRENLLFSAALRLSSKITKKEREVRVQAIIDDLGLNAVSDSKIGTELIRGVSGGEKKRASIGMELIISPDILFLDEPTTGLDASTACDVMELLFNQARKGRTIILSIHQPRYSIYRLFDTLTILSDGKLVYHGISEEALDYFGNLGLECERHNNPPDFFLDIINRERKSKKMAKVLLNYDVIENHKNARAEAMESWHSLTDSYENSKLSRDILKYVHNQVKQFEKKTTVVASKQICYPTSFSRQFGFIFLRAALSALRNPQTSIFQILLNVFIGLVVGGIYYDLGLGRSGYQDRVGVFFFLCINVYFACMSALQIFIKERKMFLHEAGNGYYRVSSYFLAKILVDIISLRFIPILVLASITYWMVGLRSDFTKYLIYTACLWIVTLSGSGLAFFISASVSVFAVANLLMVFPAVIMFIFSGLLINLKTLTKYLRWIKYFSVVRYGINILSINELHGLTFDCGLKPKTNISLPCPTGDEQLNAQGIELNEIWLDFIAIGSITIFLLILTYIQLRRMKKST